MKQIKILIVALLLVLALAVFSNLSLSWFDLEKLSSIRLINQPNGNCKAEMTIDSSNTYQFYAGDCFTAFSNMFEHYKLNN